MKSVLGASMLLALAACGTSPVDPSSAGHVPNDRVTAYQTMRSGDAKIVVTRDTGVYGMACGVDFIINGVTSASFRAGETAEFYRPAGRYVLSVETTGMLCSSERKSIETTVDSGATRNYRIAIYASGGLGLEPN